MSLLKKFFGSGKSGQADSSSTHAQRDALVLEALADRGDSGTTPRHTLFYFYGGNLKGLAAAASCAGFIVERTMNNDGAILETTMSVDEESFAPVQAQMEAWAEEFECEYDGWECAMVVN